VLYLADTVIANNVEVTKTSPFSARVGDTIRLRVKPVTCADADVYNPHVYVRFREAADTRVYLRVDTLDGGVDAYNGSAWVDYPDSNYVTPGKAIAFALKFG
jgi:hypothetical protein